MRRGSICATPISHGAPTHPPYVAGKLLLEAASYDTNPDRAQLLYLIAHGQLDNAIRRLDLLLASHSEMSGM